MVIQAVNALMSLRNLYLREHANLNTNTFEDAPRTPMEDHKNIKYETTQT